MIKFKITIYTTLLSILFMGCDDDFLNTQPQEDQVLSNLTWTDGPLSQAYIFGVYSALGYGGFEEEMLASLSDEAMFTHAGRGINVFNSGLENPSSEGQNSSTYHWGNMYNGIRRANLAIAELPNSTFRGDELRERLMGEAYFLRAYFYHQLLRYYGGFAIVAKTYDLEDDFEVARNTFEECVDFIISDLDSAATLLDGKDATAGRASRLSALALKSRVLLYAASDLRDGPTAASKSVAHANYAHLELVAYTSGDRNERWVTARNAAQEALDEGVGYKLDLTGPVSAEEGRANYLALSMGGGSAVADPAAAVELIFQRTSTPEYTEEDGWPLGGIHFGINNGPNGYHNWAGNTPIQQLVDDYEMMDGSSFDWDNPSHKADPYADRDPRFYATVLYDGADWKPRPNDVADKEPANQIQTGYYFNGGFSEKGDSIFLNGLDTRNSTVEDWNGSRTHYYLRKFIDPNPDLPDNQSNAQVIPWPYIRYTEIALNYAEACIETGLEAEALLWINRIRYRAGMPEITESGTALRDRYRNERRIELAYEEHRYHDARRWMIAAETLGRPVKKMNVRAILKTGATPNVPYVHDKAKYDYYYTPSVTTENDENRTWDDKMYFRVLTRDELNQNPLLIQNPGY